jgi:hypothetical protein
METTFSNSLIAKVLGLLLFIFFIFGVNQEVKAQEKTLIRSQIKPDTLQGGIAMYAFPPNYYVSEIEMLYGPSNGVNYKEAKKQLTSALFKSLNYEGAAFFEIDFVHWNDSARFVESLSNTRIVIDYKAKTDEIDESANFLKRKKQEKAIEKEPKIAIETKTESGQLKTERAAGAMRMQREFYDDTDPKLFISDSFTEPVKYLVFLNGYNAKKKELPGFYDAKNLNYEIQLELFYSIFSPDGTLVKHGVLIEKIPASENRLSVIGGRYFNQLSKQLFDILKK